MVFISLRSIMRDCVLYFLSFITVLVNLGFTTGCEDIPELNKYVVSFAHSQMGKQVDRGECWDLAAMALNKNNAEWDGEYVFGEEVDEQKECIYPGDIVQFEGVEIEYTEGNTTHFESMGHHTAIIYLVKGKGKVRLIHQNTGFSGRKVGISNLDFSTIVAGEYTIYRPQAKK